jgi:hypothetical protein
MGLRLLLLEWWTPKYLIRKELTNLSNQTIEALRSLLTTYAPQELPVTTKQQIPKSIDAQRTMMAKTHAELVETLEAEVGHQQAVALGRDCLFAVGVNLGKQTRSNLGVGDNTKDLIRAAKILYRILGIEFRLQGLDRTSANVIINRCALAQQYSKLTCEVLSATDEGVIKGLQSNATMQFKKYMTSGCQACIVDIQFNEKETVV